MTNIISSGHKIGLSPTTIYTTPAYTTFTLENFLMVNTGSNNCVVTLYIVPDGGSADDSNLVLKKRSLYGDETLSIPLMFGMTLTGGETMQLKSSIADKVYVRFTGNLRKQ